MLPTLLLPHRFKIIGWILFIPTLLAGLALIIADFEPGFELLLTVFSFFNDDLLSHDSASPGLVLTDVTATVLGLIFIFSGLLVAFSKEKIEDEYISEIRLQSLLWAVWVNYILLFFAFLFIYGVAFLDVMVYNMFTVLIIFIIRFQYTLYKSRKTNL